MTHKMQEEILLIRKSLNKSVAKALKIKKALGHYAVFCDEKTGKVVKVPAKKL